MISLSELKAVVDAMTPGPWSVDGPWPYASIRQDGTKIADMELLLQSDLSPAAHANADGIAALRNAAPMLIGIAIAALEMEMAAQQVEVSRQANKRDSTHDSYTQLCADMDKRDDSRAAFKLALSKVRP